MSTRVQVVLTDEQAQKLAETAKRQNRTKSNLAAKYVREGLVAEKELTGFSPQPYLDGSGSEAK